MNFVRPDTEVSACCGCYVCWRSEDGH